MEKAGFDVHSHLNRFPNKRFLGMKNKEKEIGKNEKRKLKKK